MKAIKLIITLLILGNGMVYAQGSADPKLVKRLEKANTIKKFMAQDEGDFWKYQKSLMYQNQGFDDGHGMWAWPPSMGNFPKRVGLVTFVVFDPGYFEKTTKKYGYMQLTTSSYGALSVNDTKTLANGLYKMCLPTLKEAFASVGSTLLTPEEFATDPATHAAYENFSFQEKGFAKMFSVQGGINTLAVADGQHPHYADNLTMPDFVTAMGKQAEALGLDAVMMVKVQMGVDEEGSVLIQSVSSAMYGKNPTPKDPGKKYIAINPATGYNPYVVFSGVRMGMFDTNSMLETKEGMNVVVAVSSKNGYLVNFDDFDKLMGRICGKPVQMLNSWIKGERKPFKEK